MTDSTDKKVQWLIDRARISDLLFSFARSLDTRDFEAYIDNYTEDGTLELPDPTSDKGAVIVIRRDQMKDALQGLKKYSATHHLSANHQITIEGEWAGSRSYLQAVHVGKSPLDHWDAGGWYDCEYRRTPEGWKFSRVKLTSVWMSGTPESVLPG